jgi:hypothetical protein
MHAITSGAPDPSIGVATDAISIAGADLVEGPPIAQSPVLDVKNTDQPQRVRVELPAGFRDVETLAVGREG